MRDEPRVQIIGLGSPYGADRLGWMAIDQLQAGGFPQRFPPGLLHLGSCPSPAHLPALIEPGAALLLIDALQGVPLGDIVRLSWRELAQAPLLSGSHGLGLREILPLIESLYGLPAQAVLFGIGMGDAAQAPEGLPAAALTQLERELALTLSQLHVLPCAEGGPSSRTS
jgi:Ni,Fe-hydrogenase maturation factor